MRTSTQKLNTSAKKAAVGVIVVINITLGLESVGRELKLMGREEISNDEAIEIAKRRYTSIIHLGGKINVASIEKYQPIRLGVKSVLRNLRMY
jgi:hypothetical protein